MSNYKSVAPLQNVQSMLEMVEHIHGRTTGLPGLAVFSGPAGWGKSTAMIAAANEYRGYWVSVKSLWTKKTLLEKIAEEIGLIPAKTASKILDQICEPLSRSGRPLFIDEADYLVNGNMIDLVRDIYEGSEAPIVLIGEEGLPSKLTQWERFHSRILRWGQAQPATPTDVNQLADIHCPNLTLDDALKGHILAVSSGSLRYICNSLDAIRIHARAYNKSELVFADIDEALFHTGESPRARIF